MACYRCLFHAHFHGKVLTPGSHGNQLTCGNKSLHGFSIQTKVSSVVQTQAQDMLMVLVLLLMVLVVLVMNSCLLYLEERFEPSQFLAQAQSFFLCHLTSSRLSPLLNGISTYFCSSSKKKKKLK